MSKLYFYNEDDESCLDMESIKDMIRCDELKERVVFEAARDIGSGMFWCKTHQFAGEVGDGCGKICSEYKPRNGKNGRCIHSGYCYIPIKEVLVKV